MSTGSVWCTVSTPWPTRSPTRTTTTPSGNRRRPAISAIDRGGMAELNNRQRFEGGFDGTGPAADGDDRFELEPAIAGAGPAARHDEGANEVVALRPSEPFAVEHQISTALRNSAMSPGVRAGPACSTRRRVW